MNLEKFAKRLQERRQIRRITQAEIAQNLGLTPQTVSKWERGLCAPDLDNLIDLAKMLSCSVDYLLCIQNEEKQRSFIAIDGGGTKTEMVLFGEDGHIHKRLVREGTNPNSVGRETARDRIISGLDELISYETPAAIFAGVAGASTGGHGKYIHSAITSHTKGIPLAVTTDIMNVIHSVRDVEQCIAVISGTGSSVFAYDGEELRRFGGWGYLFDGAGSGYDIGRDVLCACFALDDGFGKASLVTAIAEEKLGGKAIDHLTSFYSGGRDKIAAFAPIAFEAYRQGDAQAKAILHQNLDRLAMLIQAADNGSKTVILSGGLTGNTDIFRPYLEQKLGADIRLIFPTLPQIYGAALAAMKLVDCKSDIELFDLNFEQDYSKLKRGLKP